MSAVLELRAHAGEEPVPERSVPSTFVYRACRRRAAAQRSLDLAIAVLALVVAVPLLTIAAILIRLEDGGPVLFRQRRVGQYGSLFTIYKLRTMRRRDCTDRPSPASAGDARITAVGRFLRKTSIDELPQLLNVLRGDMSFIGPRPEMEAILRRYEGWQHLRHLIPPGITCIWQTTCRSTIPLDRPEATKLDLDYIRFASPLLDGALLWRTIVSVVSGRGAF